MTTQASKLVEPLSMFRAKGVTFIAQQERADCGLACLAMVLNWHGVRIDLNTMISVTGSSALGNTVRDIVLHGKAFGLIGRSVKLGLNRLGDLRLPAILHWDMNHFVVLESVGTKGAVIVDPAIGRSVMPMEALDRHFTGVAIEFQPNDEFRTANLERRLRMRDLLNAIRGIKPMMALLFAVFFVLNLIGFFIPQVMQFAIDLAVQQKSAELVPVLFGLLFLLSMIVLLVTVLTRISMANFSARASLGVFQRLFLRLLYLPTNYFGRRSVGDTIGRVQGFNQVEQMITSESVSTLINSFFGLAALVIVAFYSPILAAICVAFAVADVVIFFLFRRPLRISTNRVVAIHAAAESKMIEAVRAAQSIKSLGIEEQEHQNVTSRMAEATNAGLRLERLNILQSIPTEIVSQLRAVVIPAVAIYLVAAGSMTIGMLYAVLAYTGRFSEGVTSVIGFLVSAVEARVHVDRLADIVLEPTERPLPTIDESDESNATIASGFGAEEMPAGRIDTIALDKVGFSYAPTLSPVFENLSLEVTRGERICLIGPSGAGKSTILRLLAGLERPASGKHLVNGVPLVPEALPAFRRRVGLLLQNDVLFSGSILDNVCKGQIYDEAKALEALDEVELLAEILMLPMGTNTLIGDMGSVLSAGQQQRLILARALYRKPDILLLDEGTANLDPENKKAIFSKLCNKDIGLVYTTHDRETIRYATSVYELEDGFLTPRQPAARKSKSSSPRRTATDPDV